MLDLTLEELNVLMFALDILTANAKRYGAAKERLELYYDVMSKLGDEQWIKSA